MCGSHGGELREGIVQRAGGQAVGRLGGGDGVGECSAGASLWLLRTQVAPCSCFSRRQVKVRHRYWPRAASSFGSARVANAQWTVDVRAQAQLLPEMSEPSRRWPARTLMLYGNGGAANAQVQPGRYGSGAGARKVRETAR